MYQYDSIWDRSIRFDQELSMINSYEAAGKRQIISYVEKLLREETPAEVRVLDADTDEPFLIASLKPKDAAFRFLLEGHVDVVSPEGMEKPFDGEISGGYLYGRGVSDMKGGAAAQLAAFIAAANTPDLKQEVYLMFSTDEEYAGAEIKKALETGLLPKVDFAMIAEPTDMKLVAVHKGEAWADVEFFGKSAHSSIPWEGRNAICMAARFIEKLQFRIHELEAQATEDGVPTMNVGVISGGSSPNVVPPYAKVKVDIRYLPGQGYEQYAAVLEEVLDACKSEWPEFTGKVTVTGNWNSLLTRRDEPVLKRVEQLITESTGEPVAYTTLKGWGEGGYINMFGIPTVYYGPGDGTYSHKPDEKIEIRRIPIVAKVYYNILKGLCF